MVDSSTLVDQALEAILKKVEDGSAETAQAQRISESIHAAGLAPSESLQGSLVWQNRRWWLNSPGIEMRRQVSELLRAWHEYWPEAQGCFFAYRGEAVREALAQSAPAGDEAQSFLESEIIEIAQGLSVEWLSTELPQLPSSLSQGRAVLLETVLRAELRDRSDDEGFAELPQHLLELIIQIDETETDRAFDVWLKRFAPHLEDVWKAISGMERKRWEDIAEFVGSYVGTMDKTQATRLVTRMVGTNAKEAVVLLKEIHPNDLVQSQIAMSLRRLLKEATNSRQRTRALEKIDALGLTTNDARAQLVDQIFETASQSGSAAQDVFRAFPKNLREAPGVRARYRELKKAVDPSLLQRAERFRKKMLGF